MINLTKSSSIQEDNTAVLRDGQASERAIDYFIELELICPELPHRTMSALHILRKSNTQVDYHRIKIYIMYNRSCRKGQPRESASQI